MLDKGVVADLKMRGLKDVMCGFNKPSNCCFPCIAKFMIIKKKNS